MGAIENLVILGITTNYLQVDFPPIGQKVKGGKISALFPLNVNVVEWLVIARSAGVSSTFWVPSAARPYASFVP